MLIDGRFARGRFGKAVIGARTSLHGFRSGVCGRSAVQFRGSPRSIWAADWDRTGFGLASDGRATHQAVFVMVGTNLPSHLPTRVHNRGGVRQRGSQPHSVKRVFKRQKQQVQFRGYSRAVGELSLRRNSRGSCNWKKKQVVFGWRIEGWTLGAVMQYAKGQRAAFPPNNALASLFCSSARSRIVCRGGGSIYEGPSTCHCIGSEKGVR